MPEQALYLKWRPVAFDDFVGQEHVIRTLRNSLKTGRIRHAYLFSGPRGTGKTTTARLLAKAVNCQNPDPDLRPCNACHACIAVNEGRYLDLIEIDAATHTGVDDVRDLREKIAFSPGEGQYKVYIIDEVHRFTGNAFDALLKTLEEPPDHAIFVLATTEIDKVPSTIKSRCLQFEFRLFSVNEVADRLAVIAAGEGLNIEREALEAIARQGTGSARDSISLLDQIVSDPHEVITLELVQRILGTGSLRSVKELAEALIDEDVARGLHIINAAVDAGSDPRQFGQQVVEHLRSVLLTQTASADLVEASEEDRALYTEQSGRVSRGALLHAIRAFNEAVNNYKGGWQPQLALELALIESVHQPEDFVLSAAPLQKQTSAQPSAANQLADEPQVEPTAPGAPPLIAMNVLRDSWDRILKALFRYSSNGPALMQHFRVIRVDGNQVFLGTTTELYFQKLQFPEKIRAIERALHDVHQVQLRVKIVLIGKDDLIDDRHTPSPDADLDMTDPLILTGLELGGEIRYDDDIKE